MTLVQQYCLPFIIQQPSSFCIFCRMFLYCSDNHPLHPHLSRSKATFYARTASWKCSNYKAVKYNAFFNQNQVVSVSASHWQRAKIWHLCMIMTDLVLSQNHSVQYLTLKSIGLGYVMLFNAVDWHIANCCPSKCHVLLPHLLFYSVT